MGMKGLAMKQFFKSKESYGPLIIVVLLCYWLRHNYLQEKSF